MSESFREILFINGEKVLCVSFNLISAHHKLFVALG